MYPTLRVLHHNLYFLLPNSKLHESSQATHLDHRIPSSDLTNEEFPLRKFIELMTEPEPRPSSRACLTFTDANFLSPSSMPVAVALIPQEIFERVLAFLDPLDVASFSQTSKQHNNLVYHSGDNYLWRALYLAQPFDDPRLALTPRLERTSMESIDWKGSLQAIIRARTLLNNPSKCRPGERETIFRTFISMLRGATAAHSFCEKTLSKNLIWLVAMLRDGAFLNDGILPSSSSPTEAQLRAYLLVHLGLTPSDARSVNKAAARAFVYDMRNYCFDGQFGPYLPDGSGRVNWVHIHAIHRAIAMHLVDLRETEPFVFPLIPISMPYCQSIIPLGLDLKKVHDWAGIEGLWHCSYCFVDHRELLREYLPPFHRANINLCHRV